ncbi:hypothetical protein FRC07_002232 [Ceratobasidium sp. 392]|nr:hypothetical protein FRC07_002232 [Ceratobasidium sp. 392]
MAGGRSKSTLVRAEDMEYRCRCTAICSKCPEGYKDLKQKAYKKHQRDEENLRERIVLNIKRQKRNPTEEFSAAPGPSNASLQGAEFGSVSCAQSPPMSSSFRPNSDDILRPSQAYSPSNSIHLTPRSSPNLDFGSDGLRDISPDEGLAPIPPRLENSASPFPNSPRLDSCNAELPQEDLEIHLEPGDTPEMFERPTYIKEHRAIRLTYLRVARLNVVNHLPVKAANQDLATSLECLWEAGLDPPLEPKPALTLETVWRRLGLQVDEFLRRQPVCSQCYQRFTFDEIASARVEKCFRDGCTAWDKRLMRNMQPTHFMTLAVDLLGYRIELDWSVSGVRMDDQ